MTDRELLELAAKACGLEKAKLRIEFNQWNPLTDDGDALRLAVDLHIDICFNNQQEGVTAWCEPHGDWIAEPLAPNHYAATRRAIVRAAVEIGKGMK